MMKYGAILAITAGIVFGLPSATTVPSQSVLPPAVSREVPKTPALPSATFRYAAITGHCQNGADTHLSVDTQNVSIAANTSSRNFNTQDPKCYSPQVATPMP